ncbi:MAG: HYC_CC_PP family protein [Ferruginibacter sp.]
MSKALSIQLKAAFLLIIFSLNMFVGFACAVGVDMGFNTTHYHEEEATEVHVHADGKKHHHEKAEDKHSHKGGNDDCCNDKVIKLSQADKAVPQTAKLLSPVFFTAFVVTYYNINISYPSQVNTSNKYFVRGHHPPIPDIRIAIQSFQI